MNFSSLDEEINNLIEDQNRDIKYKIFDELSPLSFDSTPSIAYDYMILDAQSEYSFNNSEITKKTSEDFLDLTDAQIYFNRIKDICKKNINELSDISYFKLINPNRNLKKVVDFIFSENLQGDQIPQFIEIKLYTNKNTNKAPRVFGFIGHMSIIYILFYDPFHKIFNATGKL